MSCRSPNPKRHMVSLQGRRSHCSPREWYHLGRAACNAHGCTRQLCPDLWPVGATRTLHTPNVLCGMVTGRAVYTAVLTDSLTVRQLD